MQRNVKAAISVGGRFHSDFMLSALLAEGMDAHLFSSFPARTFERLPKERLHTFPLAEVFYRVGRKVGLADFGDELKTIAFGNWAKRAIPAYGEFDLFWGWSGFSLECLRSKVAEESWLMRDSAHIDFQMDLLRQENEKWKLPFSPRGFVVQREREEYLLADRIFVLSEFAKKTFLERGFPSDKLQVISLGVDTNRFHPPAQFSAGGPLRVIYFGTLSLRKGIQYLLEATKNFSPAELQLTLLGPVEPEFLPVLRNYSHAEVVDRMPQEKLAASLGAYHVFAFPTLEDGFGQTLVQAMAAGLVPITTTNCGAGEWIQPGKSGVVVPPFNAEALAEALARMAKDPALVRSMREAAVARAKQATWKAYSEKVVAYVRSRIAPAA